MILGKTPVTYNALRDDKISFCVTGLLETPLISTRVTRLRSSAAAWGSYIKMTDRRPLKYDIKILQSCM